MEAVEDDHDEPSDAAEGEGVGPEAAGLELAGSGSDVDGFGLCWVATGGGEEAVEEEIGEGDGIGRWGRFEGGKEEGKGGCGGGGAVVVEEEMGSEAEREACGHLGFSRGFWSFWELKQLTRSWGSSGSLISFMCTCQVRFVYQWVVVIQGKVRIL